MGMGDVAMMRLVWAATCAGAVLACSSPEDMSEGIAGDAALQTLERRVAPDAEPSQLVDEESNGEAARDFTYSWPAQVSAIEPLAALLAEARDEAQAKQKAEWDQSVEEFADAEDGYQCITCVNRSYAKNWAVVADTPRFLVITAETYTYTGGAHGNTQFDALIWDREEEAALRGTDFFTANAAFEIVAKDEFCRSLLEAKREKLDIDISQMNPLEGCPSLSELVVVPLSSGGETFDRFNFLAAPYVAGSYAEGPYMFEVAINEAMMPAIKPDYHDQFSAQP